VIGELRPYPEYTDSGMPWLGEVPAHWRTVRNGNLFGQRAETGFADLPILEVSLKTGVQVRSFGAAGRKQIMSDLAKYKRAAKGDLAYNTMRMWQGALGVCPVDGLVSPAYVVVRPYPDIEPRYFAALFRTAGYLAEIDSASHGIVKDRNRLYWEQFKQMRSPCPPLDEQAAIVRFLAWANGRLDCAIRAKRKVIGLLDEQKRAIIHRAATRGLDPSVTLKPSGVPWLGDVPQHWEVIALARVCTSRCDGPFGSGLKSAHYTDEGVRVVRLQNIGSGEFRDGDGAFISADHYATLGDHSVVEGDLLVAGLGDEKTPAGRACVAPSRIEPAMVKADCFRFRLHRGRVIAQFLAQQLSATASAATACLSTGATRLRINLSTTASRAVGMPPISEQRQILQSIDEETAPLIATISRLDREIELLREYRTRLVADVVVGRLDVRGAVALLPAEVPLDAAENDTDLSDDLEPANEEAIS
jgi:type I restriction enzyme, S subunit